MLSDGGGVQSMSYNQAVVRESATEWSSNIQRAEVLKTMTTVHCSHYLCFSCFILWSFTLFCCSPVLGELHYCYLVYSGPVTNQSKLGSCICHPLPAACSQDLERVHSCVSRVGENPACPSVWPKAVHRRTHLQDYKSHFIIYRRAQTLVQNKLKLQLQAAITELWLKLSMAPWTCPSTRTHKLCKLAWPTSAVETDQIWSWSHINRNPPPQKKSFDLLLGLEQGFKRIFVPLGTKFQTAVGLNVSDKSFLRPCVRHQTLRVCALLHCLYLCYRLCLQPYQCSGPVMKQRSCCPDCGRGLQAGLLGIQLSPVPPAGLSHSDQYVELVGWPLTPQLAPGNLEEEEEGK